MTDTQLAQAIKDAVDAKGTPLAQARRLSDIRDELVARGFAPKDARDALVSLVGEETTRRAAAKAAAYSSLLSSVRAALAATGVLS